MRVLKKLSGMIKQFPNFKIQQWSLKKKKKKKRFKRIVEERNDRPDLTCTELNPETLDQKGTQSSRLD